MKAKKGYIRDKARTNTGNWLKWYWEKRTCRHLNRFERELINQQIDSPPEFTKTIDDNFWDMK